MQCSPWLCFPSRKPQCTGSQCTVPPTVHSASHTALYHPQCTVSATVHCISHSALYQPQCTGTCTAGIARITVHCALYYSYCKAVHYSIAQYSCNTTLHYTDGRDQDLEVKTMTATFFLGLMGSRPRRRLLFLVSWDRDRDF